MKPAFKEIRVKIRHSKIEGERVCSKCTQKRKIAFVFAIVVSSVAYYYLFS